MADAYTIALTLLASRELSTAQLRARLLRRHFDPAEVDQVVERLTRDGSLDDERVARAAARLEATVRHRGRRRVVRRVRQLGIDGEVAEAAVNEVFGEIDEGTLLDRALERRLQGRPPGSLDRRGLARVVRSLVAQGFAPEAIYARLRYRPTMSDGD